MRQEMEKKTGKTENKENRRTRGMKNLMKKKRRNKEATRKNMVGAVVMGDGIDDSISDKGGGGGDSDGVSVDGRQWLWW